MHIHCPHAPAVAPTGALRFAVNHQTVVASRSAHELGVFEVWCLELCREVEGARVSWYVFHSANLASLFTYAARWYIY